MKNILVFMALVSLAFSAGNSLAAKGGGASVTLDATEASHLTFMREEEKLARDVYLTK